MRQVLSWPLAFVRFWYRFIIGDDWTVAAAVAVGLALTAVLDRHHIAAWWLIPLIVIIVVRVSLQRRHHTDGP